MKVYDLTLPFSEDTLVFPGTPPMRYEHTHTIEKDKYNLGLVTVNTHAGTHTDAPLHFVENGDDLAKVDVEKYVGQAVVVDCKHRGANQPIDVEDVLAYEAQIKKHKRVLLMTTWSKYYNEEKFFTDYPYVTLALAEWLVKQGVVLLGVEAPTLNAKQYIEVHQTLLSNGVAVVEGLTNLDALPTDEVFFSGAPIPLKAGDGFPLRAVGIVF